MLKLNLGSGGYPIDGYVNIDIEKRCFKVDMVHDLHKNLPYKLGSVDEIIAYHIVEHFEIKALRYRLEHWRTLLKPEGKLIIEAPDSSLVLPIVLEKIERGEQGWEWASHAIYAEEHGHRCALTPKYLRALLGDGWEILEATPKRITGFPSFRLECTKKADISNAQLKMAIIIPTCNRPDSLQLCIDKCLEQITSEDHIFVVNDGDPNSVTIDSDRISVLEHCKPYFAASSARNLGIKTAIEMGFEVGIFIDDDVMLEPDALIIHRTAMKSSKYRKTLFVGRLFLGGLELTKREISHMLKFGGMVNSAFYLDALWDAGGYDERFDGEWGFNDTELVNRLIKKLGWMVRFTDASVEHIPLPPATNNYSRKEYTRNKALFQEIVRGY